MKNSNDLKIFSNSGLKAPEAYTTSIMVIDKNGDPLVGAHLRWGSQGVITDQSGEAIVTVPSENTEIRISYMGKRDHIAKYSDLVNAMITMQDQNNNLPPVVVGPTKPTPQETVKKTNWMATAAVGLGAILLIAALTSGKKKGLNAPKPKQTKKPKTKKTTPKKNKSKKRKGLREPFEIEL